MRTLLRSIRTGDYLHSFETWTSAPGEAFNFRTIGRALDLVQRRGLRDMELVLTDEMGPPTTVPIAKLNASYAFAQPRAAQPGRRKHL